MSQFHLQSKQNLTTSPIAISARRAEIAVERERLLAQGIETSDEKTERRLMERRLLRAILATLSIAGFSYRWRDRISNHWFKMQTDRLEIELRANGLYWQNEYGNRTLIYNLTVPLVENNVDLCLFDAAPKSLDETEPKSYIALGELKGGIDPAGADEHWKTARTALERIRRSFSGAGHEPYTFFIGAAVEKKMAAEIWDELQKGILSNAANLNDEDQIASISHWLCNL